MIDVLCVGHACWDVIVRVPEFPAEDSKAETTHLVKSGGGPAANAAYLLGVWGARCAFAGVIGDDEEGSWIEREFHEAGVDVSGLVRQPGHVSNLSIILVSDRTGSRTIVNRKAPTAPLTLLRINGQPRVLLFDGHEPVAALEAMAHFPNATTILDAGSLRDGTRELAPRVDYLVASERFAKQVTGLSEFESAKDRATAVAALFRLNGHPVVITLGARGLLFGTDAAFEHVPAFLKRTVDTTAAGDIFHGAFTYGILTGMPFRETLRLAAMTAALSVEAPGGRSSVPSLDRVREALNHAG